VPLTNLAASFREGAIFTQRRHNLAPWFLLRRSGSDRADSMPVAQDWEYVTEHGFSGEGAELVSQLGEQLASPAASLGATSWSSTRRTSGW
jgi:hypothetical protein